MSVRQPTEYRIAPDESVVEALLRTLRATVGPLDESGTGLADRIDPDALAGPVATADGDADVDVDVEATTTSGANEVSVDADAVRVDAD
jgi:hypothetical protein